MFSKFIWVGRGEGWRVLCLIETWVRISSVAKQLPVSQEGLRFMEIADLRKLDRKYLESFEMWCWRRMEKISWTAA
jgi:hypothetical protein